MPYFSSVAVVVYLLWIIICTEEIVKVSMSIIDFLGFGSASGIFIIPVTFAWTGALAFVVLAVVVVICAIISVAFEKSNE